MRSREDPFSPGALGRGEPFPPFRPSKRIQDLIAAHTKYACGHTLNDTGRIDWRCPDCVRKEFAREALNEFPSVTMSEKSQREFIDWLKEQAGE